MSESTESFLLTEFSLKNLFDGKLPESWDCDKNKLTYINLTNIFAYIEKHSLAWVSLTPVLSALVGRDVSNIIKIASNWQKKLKTFIKKFPIRKSYLILLYVYTIMTRQLLP